jgi:hypothetical protein
MKRLLLASALFVAAAIGARAATPIWSNTVGGFPVWYGAPTFSTNAYTLSSPLPAWPPYSLVNQQHVRIVVPSSGGNTGAATLNVASTGALPIVTNTVAGLSALVGGELVAGNEYEVSYSTSSAAPCSNSCYVMSWLAQSPVLAGTTQTITAAQWVAVSVFEGQATVQTLTLPASSGLSGNGGIFVDPTTAAMVIAPNSGDVITMGSVVYPAGASVLIPAGSFALVSKPSSGNIQIAATATYALAASGAALFGSP